MGKATLLATLFACAVTVVAAQGVGVQPLTQETLQAAIKEASAPALVGRPVLVVNSLLDVTMAAAEKSGDDAARQAFY